jgi:hypothetical protein
MLMVDMIIIFFRELIFLAQTTVIIIIPVRSCTGGRKVRIYTFKMWHYVFITISHNSNQENMKLFNEKLRSYTLAWQPFFIWPVKICFVSNCHPKANSAKFGLKSLMCFYSLTHFINIGLVLFFLQIWKSIFNSLIHVVIMQNLKISDKHFNWIKQNNF